jgi:hypothetical protein
MAASERETQQQRIDSYRSVEGSRFDGDGGSYSFRPSGAWAGEGSAKELRGGMSAERLEGGSSRQEVWGTLEELLADASTCPDVRSLGRLLPRTATRGTTTPDRGLDGGAGGLDAGDWREAPAGSRQGTEELLDVSILFVMR